MKTMFKELEVVRLKVDLPEQNLKAGTIRTVVLAHTSPCEGYEVEFSGKDGVPISKDITVALLPIEIEKV